MMNTIAWPIWLSFSLLGMAICAAWYPSTNNIAGAGAAARLRPPPWLLLFGAAIASGLAAGILAWIAVLELALFGAVAYAAGRDDLARRWRLLSGIVCALMALALAMHALPGFNNPVLIAKAQFSPGAAPFTQYANFDKAAVGLILLACLCRRAASAAQWRDSVRRALPIAAATIVVVMAVALLIAYVKLDLHLPRYTAVFIAANILFTCVAEEAFFRGFLQQRLSRALASTALAASPYGAGIALVGSAVAFGAVHVGGGPVYVLLATLCGLGYAYAYSAVRRIEASVIVHGAFNIVHFLAFSYPYLLPL